MTHLLKKPPIGGMPTSESDAIMKHHIVTGILRPTPFRRPTSRIPSFTMKIPATMNSVPLEAAWLIR